MVRTFVNFVFDLNGVVQRNLKRLFLLHFKISIAESPNYTLKQFIRPLT